MSYNISQGSAVNFSPALFVNGVPVFGGGLIGMSGAQVFFVDPQFGVDAGSGTADLPYATLQFAHDQTTSGRGDIVVLKGGPASDGSTDNTARLSTTLTWSHNNTHLIGIGAPSLTGARSRISTATGATANLAPLITVSGSGCIFSNLSIFQGVGQASTDEKLIDVTGSRNYFWGVDFQGMGSANGAARSGSYVINLSGSENTFERCTVGVETEPRSAANASVLLSGANCQRNAFLDCWFQMYATANSPLYLNANTAGVLNGSTMLFKNCTFGMLYNASGSTQPSVTCTVSSTANGTIIFDSCSTAAAKWAAATALVKVASLPVSNGFNGGVMTSAADS